MLLALFPAPVHARSQPFSTGQTIAGNFGGVLDIATADLDGDGDLDVLGAAENVNDIAWWENAAGDGTSWSKHLVDGSFEHASSVAAADLDGDGDMDILGAAPGANDVAWWENETGDASAWTQHAVDSSFSAAWDVIAGDVDNDGDMDILGVGYEGSSIAWWENTAGDGSAWSKYHVTTDTYLTFALAAADIDGDGDLDVLGASEGEEAITWWENRAGDGSAWLKYHVEQGVDSARDVAAADVDGDGDLDILGALQNEGMIWWENVAGDGGTWDKHAVTGSHSFAWAVAAADVDGDGDMDLLNAPWTYVDQISWYENTSGDGSAWHGHHMASDHVGWNGVAAADVDGDGDLDILGIAHDDGDIAWWENKLIHSSALFPGVGKTVVDGAFEGTESVAVADLDSDGDLDILAAGGVFDTIAWWKNTARHGSTWSKQIVDANFGGAVGIAPADVDGDGDLDILGAAFNSASDISWWENTAGDGSAWSRRNIVADISGASSVAAADMDGDGDLDVVGSSLEGDMVAWWQNTARDGSAWSRHAVDGGFDEAQDVAAVDVDGDGDLDILGAGYAGDVAWWQNTAGDGSTWSKHLVAESFDGAVSVVAADVDGDGDPDILGAASVAGDLTWWENSTGSGGAWTQHPVDPDVPMPLGIAAADLDRDGDVDLLNASSGDGAITWWENAAGDGSAWSKHSAAKDFAGASAAAAADVDGDGDLDLVGAAQEAKEIAWWANRGGQFALTTASTAPTQLTSGQTDDLLMITMAHRGRSGDGDEELATLELLFEDGHGIPLTTPEASSLVGKLAIYLDDGSGAFEINSDTLVAGVDSLSLTGGIQTVALTDGDANVQVQFGAPRIYFAVVEMTADAYTQTAVDQFRVTHVTASSSTAQDRDHGIPLILEYAADAGTGNVAVPVTRVWDGGGATPIWSEAANWASDVVPRHSTDGVRFDSTSTKNAVVDKGFANTIMRLTIASGYAGQITQNADLTISGDWVQDGGTFTGGGRLDIGGAFDLGGGTFTAPSGLMSAGGGFRHSGGTFNPNGGRVLLDNTTDQTLATTFNDLILNDGLLGYWKLDGGVGTTAADSSGYGHDGTLQRTPILEHGRTGHAL